MSKLGAILFTSTGRPSRYIISSLLDSPQCPEIRIITRSGSNVRESFPHKLQVAPHSIIVVDHFESKEYRSAFQGADIVFSDGMSIDAKEEAAGAATIDAARAAEVRHFIFLSVFQPMRTKLHTHFAKLRLANISPHFSAIIDDPSSIEEYLLESRLNYTILQVGQHYLLVTLTSHLPKPPHYMQNVDLAAALKTGKIHLGFSSSISQGFLDLVDLAAVVLKIIHNPSEHNYARYELVAQNVTYDQIAETISKISRKVVRCQVLDAKEYLAMMNQRGEIRNEYAEDAVLRIMMYYDRW